MNPDNKESPVIRNGDYKEGQVYRIKEEHALYPERDNLVTLHRFYDNGHKEWSTKEGDFVAEDMLEPVDADILGALKKVRQRKVELRIKMDALIEKMTKLDSTEEDLQELL